VLFQNLKAKYQQSDDNIDQIANNNTALLMQYQRKTWYWFYEGKKYGPVKKESTIPNPPRNDKF
jgi:hypothetical protein